MMAARAVLAAATARATMAVALHSALHFQPQDSFQPQENFRPSDRTRELADADIDKKIRADADIDRKILADADREGKILSDTDFEGKILTDVDFEERYVNDLERKIVADLDETPPEVQAELDQRRRKLEDDNRALDMALDLGLEGPSRQTGKQHRALADHHLWLKGKARQSLTNYNEVQYIGFMEVGNQTISGIIDTGSFELVVFSTVCETCGQAGRYNPAFSGFHRQGKLSTSQYYGSGNTFSQEAFDMVSIGPYAPTNQSFWEVTRADMPVLSASSFQSIIGVGPPETPAEDAVERLRQTVQNVSKYEAEGKTVPSDLMKSLLDRKMVMKALESKKTMLETFETKMFSVCIGKQLNSPAYVIWSDTAPLVKPEYFLRVPVIGNHTWSIRMEAPVLVYGPDVSAADKKFEGVSLGCENGCAALMDSGTSLLAMPGSVINEIVQITLENDFNCTELWKLPSIKLKLGGHEFLLPPDTYISEVAEEGQPPLEAHQSFLRWRNLHGDRGSWQQRPGAHCDLMVMESGAATSQGPLWILGVPFFRQYYTTFEVAGRDHTQRALHVAKASPTCHPAPPSEDTPFPPRTQLYKRLIDPTKLYVPPSVHSALSSEYVSL